MRWLALSVLLAACSAAVPDPGVPPRVAPVGPDDCGATARQNLLGLQHADLLKVEILGPVRIIRPGMAVTADFSPSRLNIALNEADVVTRVYCG